MRLDSQGHQNSQFTTAMQKAVGVTTTTWSWPLQWPRHEVPSYAVYTYVVMPAPAASWSHLAGAVRPALRSECESEFGCGETSTLNV